MNCILCDYQHNIKLCIFSALILRNIEGYAISSALLFKYFQKHIMPYKKCGACGVDNVKTDLAIFNLSKRKFRAEQPHMFLCEKHFKEEDMLVFSDGSKR